MNVLLALGFCLGAWRLPGGAGKEAEKAGLGPLPLDSSRIALLLTILIIWFLSKISFLNRTLLL